MFLDAVVYAGRVSAEYALTFRMLAAQTTWVDDTMKLLFCKGLNMELQSELTCRDEGKTLTHFIDLAIRIDNLIHSQRPLKRESNVCSKDSASIVVNPVI